MIGPGRVLSVALGLFLSAGAAHATQTSYFVDCDETASAGDGRSVAQPWTTLAAVNGHVFAPGDTLALKRGTACPGVLAPKGSGSPAAAIHLTAYGSGARPRIVATTKDRQAFLLDGQEYWDVDSLDIAGGNTFGVYVTGETGVLHHIHLSNLSVHDVTGAELEHKESGLVIISPGSAEQHFDDVLVDGVTAWNTTQWAGILVGGGNFGYPPESTWSTHVAVRNSMVHDTQGEGIVLFRAREGRIDSSVAWNTGMQSTQSIGTPNGIWTWMCNQCVVEGNEAFLTDSPGVDGGAFDIDYGNTDNSVLANYGHDTQGYCVAAFGAGGVTKRSIIRENVCLNNARSPRMAQYQGAIFLLTWNDGVLDGLTVEDNTIYWNPPGTAPALNSQATLGAGKAEFLNNTIYSTSPWMLTSEKGLVLDQNHYTFAGSSADTWKYGTEVFHSFPAYRKASGQERDSTFIRLAPGASRSWFASKFAPKFAPKFASGSASASAVDKSTTAGSFPPHSMLDVHGQPIPEQSAHWRLYARIPATLNAAGLLDDDSLRILLTLKSLALQFHANGFEEVVFLDGQSIPSQALQNALLDLQMSQTRFAFAWKGTRANERVPHFCLMTPGGKPFAAWQSFKNPADLGLTVRRAVGEPVYAAMGEQ